MATSKLLDTFETPLLPAITLKGVTNSSGRISDVMDFGRATRLQVGVTITAATSSAPTVNTPVKVYLVRNSNSTGVGGPVIDGNLSTADAGLAAEPVDAELLGSFVLAATAGAVYSRNFLAYDPGPKGSIAIWNVSGQPLGTASSSQHAVHVLPIEIEAQ